ncbi:MAG: ATP-binding protein, partial [Oscillospiraceae bacterium]
DDPVTPTPNPLKEQVLNAEYKYRIESVIYVICIVCVAGLATYMITETCLYPLVTLKNQVSKLSAANLSADFLSAVPHTGDEVESLWRAFYGMRLRLDDSFETQKRFSASAAHELRTPLSILQTKLDVFSKEENHKKEEYDALLAAVDTQTERLSLLVKDLLELSCMGEIAMDDTIFFAPMMEELAMNLEPMAAQKSMTFSVQGDATIRGNDGLVTRALFNLLENAVKYGKVGGHISLTACQTDSGAELLVSDDGPGIPPVHRSHIFEPFYRADTSRSRSMGGAGLGLAMTRSILRRHGGDVTLDGETATGATFRLTFPATPPLAEKKEGQPQGCPSFIND